MRSNRIIFRFCYLVFWLSVVSYQAKADAITDVQMSISAIAHEAVSLSGAQRNVLLRLSISWTEIDSVGFCDHQLYPEASSPACGPDILFFTLLDHILLTPANDTTSSFERVIPYPHRMMDRLVPHEEGASWNRVLCDFEIEPPPDTTHYQPGHPRVYERTITQTGDVLITIPCGTWIVHYILDPYSWDFLWATPGGWGAQGLQVLSGSDGLDWVYSPVEEITPEYTILDFVDEHAVIHLTDEVTATVCGPSPIDAHVQIRFNGYVKPDGSDGEDWLPSPGDSIGLRFGISSDVTGPINVRYTISDISMWAGQCMNSPWAAPAPEHTGSKGDPPRPISGTQFDFDAWIGNPDQYDLKVYDLKSQLDPMYADYLQLPDSVSFDSLSKSISTIVAEKVVQGPHAEEELWIVARDYGMDCSVTPTASAYQGKLAFMQALVTEFGDSVYNVTVPRDNDAVDTLSNGFARGDFLGDAWEEKYFPSMMGYDIRDIQPFIDTSAAAAGYPVMDKDSIPRGREVNHRYWDGDYLTNWEEYRGFLVLSDSLDIFSDSTHRRTNPKEKTVFVHFTENIQPEVAANIPPELFNIPGVDVYSTNYLQPIERLNHLRWISENRIGANMEYPPTLYPHNCLLDNRYHANVVTFWPTSDNISGDEDTLYNVEPSRAWFRFGITWAYNVVAGDTVFIPSSTQRILIRLGSMYQFGDWSSYYDVNSTEWQVAYSRLIRQTMMHEFGHAIGMNHQPQSVGGYMFVPIATQNSEYPWETQEFPEESLNELLMRRPQP